MAVLLTSLVVAATGLWMLRDSMQRGFSRYVAEIELKRLEPLAEALEATYRQQGWPEPGEAGARDWLRGQMARLRDTPGARFSGLFPDMRAGEAWRPPRGDMRRPGGPGGGGPPPDGPGDRPPPHGDRPPPEHVELDARIGLLDADDRLLAGTAPDEHALRRLLTVDGRSIGHLTLMTAVSPSDAIARAFMLAQHRQLLLIALVCIVLSGVAAALLAAHFRVPIRQLLGATGKLMQGRFDTRLDSRRSDELGQLADAVNHLAAMLEQHEASRRQWVADTSHELRTPVAVLYAQIEALLDGVRQPDVAQFTAMQRQIMVLGRLIDELHQLARADIGQLEHQPTLLDPEALAVSEADGFRERFAQAGLTLCVQPSGGAVRVMADAARLHQVIGNLLENSLRYTDAGGEVRLSFAVLAGEWLMHLDDSAPSVPDDVLARLGERFFRVERSRSRTLGGSGLGLALSQRLMAAQGGRIGFAHSMLGGLRVTLSLPLAGACP